MVSSKTMSGFSSAARRRASEPLVASMSVQVLIADDEALIRQSLRATLAREGFDVSVAASGNEAWLRFQEDKPDIVLLDTMLIDASGYQVCRRLKTQPETANIPVIMLISGSHPRLQSWRAEHGVDEYLPRPFTPQQLSDAIGKFAAVPAVA